MREVEAVVNSRSHVYVGDDINSKYHTDSFSFFLTHNPIIGIPSYEEDNGDTDYNPNIRSAGKLLVNP